MTRYAVLSSDKNALYSFFAPLTCAVWRARGYTPLLLLLGGEGAWVCDRFLRVVYEHCIAAGAKIVFLGDHPGHRPATVAQVSRLFAFLHAFLDDYLITSDIDMWPVGEWVGGAIDDTKALQLYYANAHDDEGRVHYPMCYLGGTAATWRKIMLGGSVLTLDGALELAAARPPSEKNKNVVHRVGNDDIPLDLWNFDETYFGECLSRWEGYPSRCQMIARDMERLGEKRIDRSAWEDVRSLAEYADAHLPRPGFTANQWPRVRRLFSMILPDQARWAGRYHDALTGAVHAEHKRRQLIATAGAR